MELFADTYLFEPSRAFGSDTEAGQLLKKLYYGTTKPKISYPSASTTTTHIVSLLCSTHHQSH